MKAKKNSLHIPNWFVLGTKYETRYLKNRLEKRMSEVIKSEKYEES